MAEQVSQNVDQKVMSKVQCSAQNIHDLKKKKKNWMGEGRACHVCLRVLVSC